MGMGRKHREVLMPQFGIESIFLELVVIENGSEQYTRSDPYYLTLICLNMDVSITKV